MSCGTNCNICRNIIFSSSVTVGTINGVSTLLINIPSRSFNNCEKVCLVITQTIPSTATINMPVAITIGTATTVAYPLVRCDCSQVTACAIRTRTRYPLRVATTATGGVFKVLKNLCCSPDNTLASIPAPVTAAPATIN